MRACAETVRTAPVRADTTRLYPMGQEGGESGSGSPPSNRPRPGEWCTELEQFLEPLLRVQGRLLFPRSGRGRTTVAAS